MAGECKEGWMAGAEVGVSAGLSNAENMINECRGCRATGYMGGGVIKRHIMGRQELRTLNPTHPWFNSWVTLKPQHQTALLS